MLNTPIKYPLGFSLIELMIALTISLGLISALISFVTANLIGHGKLLMQQRLSDELHSIATLIQSELNRAGYDAKSASRFTLDSNFTSAFEDSIQLSAFPGEAANSCIVFSYDRDLDGELESGTVNEKFGFRLKDNAIEMRQRGLLCDANGWQDISDSSVIKIEHFSIQSSDEDPPFGHFEMRIDASAKQIPSMQRRIQQSWQITNVH